jgi:hypothetical protein
MGKVRVWILALLCLGSPALIAFGAPGGPEEGGHAARAVHVNGRGDDATGDGSRHRPFLSARRAADFVLASTEAEEQGAVYMVWVEPDEVGRPPVR